MVLFANCIPCQYGHHEHHHEVVQAVPEGMIGGVRCECKGECVEREKRRPIPQGVPDLTDYARIADDWPKPAGA